MREPLYDAYAIVREIEEENGIRSDGIAIRMNRSKGKAYSMICSAADNANIFAEILNEFGYDVIIRNSSTGEERQMRPPKQYKRERKAK